MGLPLRDHERSMRRRFPGLRPSRLRNGIAIWEGEITPGNKPYRVRIACRIGQMPTGTKEICEGPFVEILSPAPRRREEAPDEEIPHLEYRERPGYRALCLYNAEEHEWHPGMPLAEIVPWIGEWLLCYEIWHATGTWTCG